MLEIVNDHQDPFFNLAVEEYVLKNMDPEEEYFILWQNSPTVVVGRNQETLKEINPEYARERGIAVARRMSGGGAVYHDLGNLNYTFIVKERGRFHNFRDLMNPVLRALHAIGVPAAISGRNDIVVEGRKVSGNAQYRYLDRLLHHGTLLYATDLEEMARVLTPSEHKLSSKGIRSVEARVANIKEYLPVGVAIDKLKDAIRSFAGNSPLKQYRLTETDVNSIADLRDSKYSAASWIYGVSEAFNICKSARYEWGIISVCLNVGNGYINRCRISGDFFFEREIEGLEEYFLGLPYSRDAVRNLLAAIDIKEYIPHAVNEEFVKLVCPQ